MCIGQVGYFCVSVRVKKKSMVGKDVFLRMKETGAGLDMFEVEEGENSTWMGQQTKTIVGRLPT